MIDRLIKFHSFTFVCSSSNETLYKYKFARPPKDSARGTTSGIISYTIPRATGAPIFNITFVEACFPFLQDLWSERMARTDLFLFFIIVAHHIRNRQISSILTNLIASLPLSRDHLGDFHRWELESNNVGLSTAMASQLGYIDSVQLFEVLHCRIFPNYAYSIRCDRNYFEIEQVSSGYKRQGIGRSYHPYGQHCFPASFFRWCAQWGFGCPSVRTTSQYVHRAKKQLGWIQETIQSRSQHSGEQFLITTFFSAMMMVGSSFPVSRTINRHFSIWLEA